MPFERFRNVSGVSPLVWGGPLALQLLWVFGAFA